MILKAKTSLTSVLVIASLVCLGAGANESAENNQTRDKAPIPAQRLSLEPVRVIYRQVEGIYLKSPRGVFLDRSKEEIYVADTSNNLVAVYNTDGLPIFAFGYNKELTEPIKAVTDTRGYIYVLDGIPRAIKIFNYRGEYLRDFPFTNLEGEINPTAIAAGDAGNIYIADKKSGQIFAFDSEHRLRLAFGAKAHGKSYFQSVTGIAVDLEGNVYVADATASPSIQVFSPEGKFLRGWGEHDIGPQNFSLPAGLAIDGEGRVIVVDTLRHALTVFTKEGRFLSQHGGKGTQPGAVDFPTDVATNNSGRVYVVERVGSRLQILEERLLTGRQNGSARRANNLFKKQIRSGIRDFIKEMP